MWLRFLSSSLWAILIAAVVLGGTWSVEPARAVQPDEILKDAALEKRARIISAELRCLVCQNQSIDDSNAPLARDLRILVRERLKAGDSNDQVFEFVVERYGEFVLLKPPFGMSTLLLWLSPFLIFALAAFLLFKSHRSRCAAANAAGASAGELSAEELAALERLTGGGESPDPGKG